MPRLYAALQNRVRPAANRHFRPEDSLGLHDRHDVPRKLERKLPSQGPAGFEYQDSRTLIFCHASAVNRSTCPAKAPRACSRDCVAARVVSFRLHFISAVIRVVCNN